VTEKPRDLPALWRVGHYADPLGFTPRELYSFSHRFDDIHRRFRTLYCAELPETCLREVLADFRPNLAAQRRHVERFGPDAAEDFTSAPVTARWRAQHVLVPVAVRLDGPLVDLIDVPTRQEIEDRHVALLVEHGLEHLDLHEITTSRRVITQTIAADLFERGASAVRFPSRLDGSACVALFEIADPSARRKIRSRSRTRRRNRSPRSPRRGGLRWSPRPQAVTIAEFHERRLSINDSECRHTPRLASRRGEADELTRLSESGVKPAACKPNPWGQNGAKSSDRVLQTA
jgi:hypothetical protein